jgi:hypothetical protein
MVHNIKFVCYLFNKNYYLFIQGNRWLYFFHYTTQTLEKWGPSHVPSFQSSTRNKDFYKYKISKFDAKIYIIKFMMS